MPFFVGALCSCFHECNMPMDLHRCIESVRENMLHLLLCHDALLSPNKANDHTSWMQLPLAAGDSTHCFFFTAFIRYMKAETLKALTPVFPYRRVVSRRLCRRGLRCSACAGPWPPGRTACRCLCSSLGRGRARSLAAATSLSKPKTLIRVYALTTRTSLARTR